MKNLKKSLALVLALVMVFSLCIFANAAFEDQDAIGAKYETACGVMNGLGILKGDENGVFNPQGNLTRGQACKIIAYIKLGAALAEKLSTTAAPFNDVAVTDWEAPFVAYCKLQKIVSGYGDGNFGKDDYLTGFQFGKMLLVALGYGQNGEYEGEGWEMNVAQDAAAAGVYGITLEGATSALLTREQAAQLAFNTIGAELVIFSKDTESYKGTLRCFADTLNFNLTPVSDAVDKAGRPVERYVTLDGTGKVVYEKADEPLAVINNGVFTTAAGAYKDWNVATAKTVINGDIDGATTFAATDINGKPGRVAELYGTKNPVTGAVTVKTVVVTDYYFAIVKAIDATTKAITLVDGDGTELTVLATNASYKLISGFAKGDVLCLTSCNEAIATAEKAAAVTGTSITAVNTTAGTFKIDGTQYAVAHTNESAAPALGKIDGTYYLDPNGYVIGYVGAATAAVEDTIVYVVAAYTVAGASDGFGGNLPSTFFVQAVNADGEVVTYQTEELYVVDASHNVQKVTETYNAVKGVTYATFSNPTYNDATTVTTKATDVKFADSSCYFDSAVKFIFVSGSKNALKVTVKDGVQALTSKPVEFAANRVGTTSNYNVKVVFVEDAYVAPVVTSTEIIFVNGDKTSTASALVTNARGAQVTGYAKTVYIDGVKTDIYVGSADALGDGFYTYIKNGDIYALTAKTAATLVAPSIITNVYGSLITTGTSMDVNVANATFVNMTANVAKTGVDKLAVGDEIALVKDAKGAVTIVYLTGSLENDEGWPTSTADYTALTAGTAFYGIGGPASWGIDLASADEYIAWKLPGGVNAHLTVVKYVLGETEWTYEADSSSTVIGFSVLASEYIDDNGAGVGTKLMGDGWYDYVLRIGSKIYTGSFEVYGNEIYDN